MEIFLYILSGIAIGAVISWLLVRSKIDSAVQAEKNTSSQRIGALQNELVAYKATSASQQHNLEERLNEKLIEIAELKQTLHTNNSELVLTNNELSMTKANLQAANRTILDKNGSIESISQELAALKKEFFDRNKDLATANAEKDVLQEKLRTQKEEIEALGKKFNMEFENIANKILETKSEKFTQLNRENLKTILEPLGKNLSEFKAKVEEVYDKESKERFSLGEKVKDLAQLNQVISEEARSLTRALKGESKTQGRWGEVILETILEKSGLRKDEEFFMEHQLYDVSGNPLRSEARGRKMRPDAVVKYPDQRHVIIDAKVSLNAYVRFTEAVEITDRQIELMAHVQSVKNHIIDLSSKAYDDYDKTLDFVMMFVPNEAAYTAAMQGDAGLWEFAYSRRILLISPTNLITSLKLIVDLWKREYQNQNAQAIAERGAKLYDKFVGFVENLEAVGKHLDNARSKYQEAYRQLHTGNDNLITQAVKLKKMGLKTKKELGSGLLEKTGETENVVQAESPGETDEEITGTGTPED